MAGADWDRAKVNTKVNKGDLVLFVHGWGLRRRGACAEWGSELALVTRSRGQLRDFSNSKQRFSSDSDSKARSSESVSAIQSSANDVDMHKRDLEIQTTEPPRNRGGFSTLPR